MVRAWYHDGDSSAAPNQPHMLKAGQFLTQQQVKEQIGVECFQFQAASLDTNTDYAKLKQDRGYDYEDVIEISQDTLPDYDKRVAAFYCEHLHPDEEVRFVMAGSGYFDMRSRDDRWIRLEIVEGDFLIIPGGTYHRFTLNPKNYIKLRRLFSDVPSWVAFNRPEADTHPVRKQYLQNMGVVAN